MSKECAITRNNKIVGYTVNGEDSVLFDELLKITGNGEDALNLYKQTRTEEFQLRKHSYQLDKNGEPIIKNKHIGLVNRVEDYFIEPKATVNFQHKTREFSGIDFVFEQSPELAKIGSKEQYSQYLDTIFPNSKVKDIVYHGTDNPNFLGFGSDFSRAIHFGTLQAAKDRRLHTDFEFKRNAKFIPVILNIKNPLKTEVDFNFEGEGLEFVDDPDFDFTKEQGHRLLITYLHNKGYNVYHPEGGVYRDGEILNNAGLDSVIYKNEREDKGNYSYAVFEPEQIHILGSKQDIEGFKEFVNKTKSTQSDLSLIDNLAKFYQINTQGFFNPQVDYLKLKSEALKLGYGLKQAESKSYYLTKNGKMYLPEFLKNQIQPKLPGISLKSASKSLWTKYAELITSELPTMTQYEFELYPKSVQQKIIDCL